MEDLLPVAALFLLFIRATSGTTIELPATVVFQRNVDLTAKFVCNFNSEIEGAYWSKDNEIIYDTNRRINGHPLNYTFSSDRERGVFNLTILSLSRNNSGEYHCQPFANLETKTAVVTVGDPPGEPTLSISTEDLVENRQVTFQCNSSGGYPKPVFKWTKDGEVLTPSTTIQNGDSFISEVTTTLSYTDHGKSLKCTATNVVGSSTNATTLQVKFKPKVTIKVTGSDVAAVERGKAFSLQCDVTSFPAVSSFTWKFGGQQLSTSGAVLEQSDGIQDETLYECTVSNSVGDNTTSQSIEVHYAPVVSVVQGDSYTLNESQRLLLKCQADAKPDNIAFQWVKDGNDLTFTSELSVSSVKAADAGTYTCSAANTMVGGIHGNGSKSIDVVVNYAPNEPAIGIAPFDQSSVYRAGGDAALTCSGGEGHPEVTYKWFRSGQELPQVSKILSINVTTFVDSGTYRCQTLNIMGKANSSDLIAEFHEKPEFVNSSALRVDLNATDEKEFISCKYQGLPRPDVLWYRNGVLIQPNNHRYNIEQTVNFTSAHSLVRIKSALKFKGAGRRGVDMDDAGTYKCRAKSSLGFSLTSRTFTVNVQFSPAFIGQKKVAADLGSTAVIECEVRSYPPASSIIFTQDGSPMVSGVSVTVSGVQTVTHADFSSQRMTLTFSNVQSKHYGSYACRATNSLNTTQQTLILQEVGRPDAPADILVTNKTWSSVSVRWTAGFDGGKTQDFVAMVNGKQHQTGSDNAWTLNGLHPNTEYNIQILGENSLGQSEPSPALVVRTLSLSIPTPRIVYDEEKTLTITFNSTQFCVIILGSELADGSDSVALFQRKCHFVQGEQVFKLKEPLHKYYLAKACVSGRENDVCSSPAKTKEVVTQDKWMYIVIGVVVGVVLLFIIVAAVAVVIVKRRKSHKKINKKSISAPLSSGHVNPVMIRPTDEIETETPYATFSPNNDLNTGSTFHQPPIADHRESENLNHIYASVQKKPTDSIKYVNTFNHQQPVHEGDYELPDREDSPNTESNSDNTEQDTLDEMPEFNKHNGLSLILGNEPANYRRFSNTSESGYSTPDSRAKKIVYEVIV